MSSIFECFAKLHDSQRSPGMPRFGDRSHCDVLIKEYGSKTDVSQTIRDMVEFLRWWRKLCDNDDPDKKTNVELHDDPNKNPFPIPDYVSNDPLILRSWICEWRPMVNMVTYVGDPTAVAWCELPCDVIKEDKTTEDQNRIIRLRECRADFNDVTRMKRRYSLLLEYFREKYHMKHSDIVQFSGFVARVVENNNNFERLFGMSST